MTDDHLARLPPPQVAAFYRRLADRFARVRVEGQEPYASLLLRHWVDNRDPASTFTINSRNYLRRDRRVLAALAYHRRVFLSQEEARVGMQRRLGFNRPVTRLAGIVPRLRGDGHRRLTVPGTVTMHYESLVEIGGDAMDIWRIQRNGSAEERDLFTSLRGFQLHSRVLVRVAHQGSQVRVEFLNWLTHVHDRYDWNEGEGLTVPNPDFRSTAPGAVRPQDEGITMFHRNAHRVERAGLAAPYNVRSEPWAVNDPRGLTAPALVSP